MTRFYEQLAAALAQKQPFVLALISGTKGSSPQRIGAKALFFPDGKIVGTLGGGCVEAAVYEEARDAIQGGAARLVTYGISDEQALEHGLTCGGTIHVFVERLDW